MNRVHRFDYLGQTIHCDETRTDGVLAKIDAKTGFLTVEARLTRVGVFTYGDAAGNTWGELRTEDQVFRPESMASFENAVLTNDHPDEFVNVKNVDGVQIGQVSNIRRDGDYMVGLVTITDSKAIEDVKAGKLELSNGYSAVVIEDSGTTPTGERFDRRQTDIEGNHVALVDRGRAGSQCRLTLDSDAYTSPQIDQPMKYKILIGDVEAEVSKEVHDAWHAQQKTLEDAKADAAKLKADQFPPPDDEEEDEEKKKKGDVAVADTSELRAELDTLKADTAQARKDEAARIDARVRLVTDAQRVLGKDTPTSGRTDAQIMHDTVLAVSPAMKADLDVNKGDAGYLRACYDQAVRKHDAAKQDRDELNRADIGGETDLQRKDLEDVFDDHYRHFLRMPAREAN
jgi:hypothetical protein